MIDPRLALVVEDDTLQREVLAEHLRDQHVSVIECDSVEAAELVLARTGLELSLLITDVELGQGATGLELAAFALERFPALKVVIVSGRGGTAAGRAMKDLGLKPSTTKSPRFREGSSLSAATIYLSSSISRALSFTPPAVFCTLPSA
jgi:DNA-binding NtrC family response regulator